MRVLRLSQTLVLSAILIFALATCGNSGGGGGGGKSAPKKSWTGAELFETGDYHAGDFQVAVDADGNAMVVWLKRVGSAPYTYDVYASRYDAGTDSWGTEELIENVANSASEPRVAVDASGNAMAVWIHQEYFIDAWYKRVYANHYDVGTDSWGTEELIDTYRMEASSPEVAMDAVGNAYAVWVAGDPADGHQYIYSNLYDEETHLWGIREPLGTNNDSTDPSLVVNTGGDAIAAWQWWDQATPSDIHAKQYDAGTGSWGTLEYLDDDGTYSQSPEVGIDSSGNVIVVWTQGGNVYARRYNAGIGSWDTAEPIEAIANSSFLLDMAVNASGKAVVVWRQFESPSVNSIYANRYKAGWGTAKLIEAGGGTADTPQVAIDASGNAIAVWRQYDGTFYSTYANHYSAQSGSWGKEEIIDAGDNHSGGAQIGFDASGNAIAVWGQSDGTYNRLYANHYR